MSKRMSQGLVQTLQPLKRISTNSKIQIIVANFLYALLKTFNILNVAQALHLILKQAIVMDHPLETFRVALGTQNQV